MASRNDEPSAQGTIVDYPGGVGRRPEPRDTNANSVHCEATIAAPSGGGGWGKQGCWPPTNQRMVSNMLAGTSGPVKDRLPSAVTQRQMQVLRLPRIGIRPFGNEGHHLALALRPNLGERLEDDAGPRRERSENESPLPARRSGFGMRLSIGNPVARQLEQRLDENPTRRMNAHRNSRTAGSQFLSRGSPFIGRVRVSSNTKKLELHRDRGAKPISRRDRRYAAAAGRGKSAAAVPRTSRGKKSHLSSVGDRAGRGIQRVRPRRKGAVARR